MKFKTKYDPPHKVKSPCGKVSLTDSQYLDDCDMNLIMKRAMKGDPSVVNPAEPVFADVSDCGDMLTCMRKVADARMRFEALPSAVRDRVGNSPEGLFTFLADPKNDEEAIKLGLKVKPKVDKPIQVEVVGGQAQPADSPSNT